MTDDTAARLRDIPVLTGAPPGDSISGWSTEPVEQFLRWLDVALESGVAEPHAASFATVDSDGMPDARVLILKDVDGRGWAFAGPASGRRGAQLAVNPAAALTFWWQPLVRSVRVRGRVVEASMQESEADLAARSEAARAEVTPGDWRLWRVVADRVEFWEGSTDRRHIRVVYSRETDSGWSVRRY
ncbi:pyridoxamine 5'-phosphate oxidase [Gordonia sp. TBRC 11910]|uniref:Pyridoxamine 5'-phosphate oxidase n=1 Tax=Gordonia asplenii TaxID=2725283 RepID=A0A848KT48_9ACTN|nr:pyridoxamine 5'-phosphate oxidase family protein [Gordonia asplenii]NMO01866.1 pyridoxamine 5'-phosphate oxidase [Gordonia asplenii]